VKPYYDQDGITIYHGNCLDVLPELRRNVDAIITDPPYAVPTVIAQVREATRSVGDLSVVEAGLATLFRAATDKLLPTGRVFVFCDGVSYPVMFRVLYGSFSQGLLVWDKGQIGMGREFRKSHELIAHGWLPDTPVFADGRGRPDILRAAPVPSEARGHPAQKPVSLIQQLLAVCGQMILDPFMGSGTTLRAAKDLGRKAIGIEIEERYCEIAANRLSQGVLFGAEVA
jgi:site-specific DNA-methyltransferase (adenine-specific)